MKKKSEAGLDLKVKALMIVILPLFIILFLISIVPGFYGAMLLLVSVLGYARTGMWETESSLEYVVIIWPGVHEWVGIAEILHIVPAWIGGVILSVVLYGLLMSVVSVIFRQ